MPQVVPYANVVETMARSGARPAYPNGGSFDWPAGVECAVLGLLTTPDATIRPGLPTRPLTDPTPAGLAEALVDRWTGDLGGPLWLLPGHHWAHELQHSGGPWAADLLRTLGLDPAALERETTAHALAFAPAEADAARRAAETIWRNLDRADWAACFPDLPPEKLALATLHHHGQLWWRTAAG